MKKQIITTQLALILFSLFFIAGCKQYDNFTTYFNTYYNADRLMNESEDEFEFQEEKRKVNPRVIVPDQKFKAADDPKAGVAPFMEEFVISQQKLQPVKIKLDSIIIKGSKIMAKHPKSDFMEATLFLMAKSYFYQSLWLPSQIKCSELVDRFPDGELVPDALLLMSKGLLMQQNYPTGSLMLSRTVDIAWQKERWDILSEAFRLQAEVALLDNDINGALKPYRQAIAQSENEVLRAKWQFDMASIYYRESMFKEAEKAFAKVQNYSPDYITTFEGYLYQAVCLIRTGQIEKGDKILTMLENDGKYQEWQNYVMMARLTKFQLANDQKNLKESETIADSMYLNNVAINAAYFEKASNFYKAKNFTEARRYFSRARNQKSSFSKISNQMFFLLNTWEQKRQYVAPMLTVLDSGKVLEDTTKMMLALGLFEIGRINEQLGLQDSTLYYYRLAAHAGPKGDTLNARYIYAYARVIRDSSEWVADSLLEVLANDFPKTEYGKDAIVKLGYTKNFVIDEAQDLYSSGYNLRKNKEYDLSKVQFLTLIDKYPLFKHSPKALYSIGWMYENEIKNQDSALFYYRMLIEKYPDSEYARDVMPGVNQLIAVKSGSPTDQQVPDSYYKAPTLNLDEISNRQVLTPAELNPQQKKDDGFNPFDIIKDPGKAFNKVIDMFKETTDSLGKQVNDAIDQVKDPKKLMENIKLPKLDIPGVNTTPPDSTQPGNIDPPKAVEPKKND
jgi:tetratricopeptide (TPR) repeat protein